jgi:hypothetical protein
VPRVVERVETHHIRVQHALQYHLFAALEFPKDLTGGKGNVEKKDLARE